MFGWHRTSNLPSREYRLGLTLFACCHTDRQCDKQTYADKHIHTYVFYEALVVLLVGQFHYLTIFGRYRIEWIFKINIWKKLPRRAFHVYIQSINISYLWPGSSTPAWYLLSSLETEDFPYLFVTSSILLILQMQEMDCGKRWILGSVTQHFKLSNPSCLPLATLAPWSGNLSYFEKTRIIWSLKYNRFIFFPLLLAMFEHKP